MFMEPATWPKRMAGGCSPMIGHLRKVMSAKESVIPQTGADVPRERLCRGSAIKWSYRLLRALWTQKPFLILLISNTQTQETKPADKETNNYLPLGVLKPAICTSLLPGR